MLHIASEDRKIQICGYLSRFLKNYILHCVKRDCIFTSPEAADIIVQDLRALLLLLEICGEELELHDHVGQPGGDLLLEEQVGPQLVGGPPVVQQMLDRDSGRDVPAGTGFDSQL